MDGMAGRAVAMQSDSIKLWFTYITALVIVVGGGAMLWFSRLDPSDSGSQQLALVVAGFVGAAIQFLFNKETSTSTARQVERATAAGAASQQATPQA